MFETEYVKELAKILDDGKLTEISIEDGDKFLTLKREKEIVTTAPVSIAPAAVAAAAGQASQLTDEQVKCEIKCEVKKGTPIKSPMVGTFYRAPSNDSDPFVEEGSNVNTGDVVCIIEAMKLMNEIVAEKSGKISEICVKNGDTVEYGQVLMYVE
jgi:acetyl-CoA carboxylase biotin carboxyl carrier protein